MHECQGNALRAHIHIGGHFMGRLVVEFVFKSVDIGNPFIKCGIFQSANIPS